MQLKFCALDHPWRQSFRPAWQSKMSSGHPRRSWWQHLSQTPLVSHLYMILQYSTCNTKSFWQCGKRTQNETKTIDLEQMHWDNKTRPAMTSQFIRFHHLLQVNAESQPCTRTAWGLPKFQHCAHHHNGMASLWWLDNLGVTGLLHVSGCQLKANQAIGCLFLS